MRPQAIAALLALFPAAAAAETPVERGAYLVNAVMACDACHTPRGPEAEGRRLAGGPRAVETAAYTVYAGNITQDRETGIGGWSDAEIARAIAEGVRPDGSPLAPEMPSAFYRALSPEDLAAVVAYLRTVAPVSAPTPAPVYRGPVRKEVWPAAAPAPAGADPVARGAYLGSLAYCMDCHGRGADGALNADAQGLGGREMTGPWGAKAAANVTAHPEAGIGGWSDAEIARALTEGVDRQGEKLIPPMARQRFYGKLTEGDVAALVAWLRSLPPRA